MVACVLWLAAGAGALLADSAKADDVPFFASRDVPDYEASMVVREWWGNVIRIPRSVLHHRGWTKVEEVRPAVTTISYGNYFDNDLILWIAKGDEAEDFGTAIVLKFTPPEVRETGDVAIQSGEVCTWRELVQTVQEEEGVKKLPWRSCLSSDGIEVAAKESFSEILDANGIELVKLERRPVSESEIRPPKRIFEPAFWLKPLRDYSVKPADRVDFEARMVTAGDRSQIRLLRHYPWRLEERRNSDGTVRFKVWNELEDQGIAVTSGDQYRFEARRSPRAPKYPYTNFDKTVARIDLKRNDVHLGETCTWFELTSDPLNPAVKNVGKTECVTPDGVPLKFTGLDASGASESFTAVEVKRRPVDLKEMLPPPELIDPSAWGFTVGD